MLKKKSEEVKMKTLLRILLVCVLASSVQAAWDLYDDFLTTTGNPDGAWSYIDGEGDPLVYTASDYLHGLPGYVSSNHTDGQGILTHADWPVLGSTPHMLTHPMMNILWTSPITGLVAINGATQHNGWGTADAIMDLTKNGAPLLTVVTPSAPNPEDVWDEVVVSVVAGDVIKFAFGQIAPNSNFYKFNASVVEIPEPMTMNLLGLGSLVTLRKRR